MTNKDDVLKFIERIQSLETEKDSITADIKEVYDEAKADGQNVKTLKAVVSLLKKDPDDRKDLTDGVYEILTLIGAA